MKRALLLGSQTHGLTGVEHDVTAMSTLLRSLGFTISELRGSDATRAGVLHAYETLIAATRPEDTVIVYYSGHGGLGETGQPASGERSLVQFIVPTDIDESTAEDFRGITSIELSSLLARLCQRTLNVTAIFDCCHSARISRGSDLVCRALQRAWTVGIEQHLTRLVTKGLPIDRIAPEGNPHALRIVACGARQSAYEKSFEGHRQGLLTRALIGALRGKSAGTTWRALAHTLQHEVLDSAADQRPEIEGPIDRVVLQTREIAATGAVPVERFHGRIRLQGGTLLGIEPGDRYLIMPPDSMRPDPDAALAFGSVLKVGVSWAHLELDRDLPALTHGTGFPLSASRPWHRVSVDLPPPLADWLTAAVGEHALLEAARNDAGFARVSVCEDKLVARGPDGALLTAPVPATRDGARAIVDALGGCARARSLRRLGRGQGQWRVSDLPLIEWGLVESGRAHRRPNQGATVPVGSRVFVRVRNPGRSTIYVSVFDIGIAGAVTLLSVSEPAGIELRTEERYTLGTGRTGELVGLGPVSWPAQLPYEGPRTETLLIIATDAPQDLRSLEGGSRHRDSARSGLAAMLAQLAQGRSRDLHGGAIDVAYSVQRIEFSVAFAPRCEASTLAIHASPLDPVKHASPSR